MGKTQRSSGRNSGQTKLIVLALIASLLGVLSIFFYYASSKTTDKIIDNIAQFETLSTQLNEKQDQVRDLRDEYEAMSDIEGRIAKIKETFFKNAVKAEELARNGEADFKICYMTFDDGPYLSTTPAFLDVLEEYDVQATFFCLEKADCDDIYKREKMNCHTIGNHTASHNIGYIYSSVDNFMYDLLENRSFIEELLGITTDVMRFPGGSPQVSYSGLDRDYMISRLREAHYGYVDWTLTTGDGAGPYAMTPDEFLHNVVDYSADYDVITILMHDYANNTLACLPEMIEILKGQGYIFLPLSYDAPVVRKGY